jgi:hypothetical protein
VKLPRRIMANPTAQVAVGAVLFVAAAYLIRDAYEGRGRRRPFAAALVLP